jgi:hypothetical protein
MPLFPLQRFELNRVSFTVVTLKQASEGSYCYHSMLIFLCTDLKKFQYPLRSPTSSYKYIQPFRSHNQGRIRDKDVVLLALVSTLNTLDVPKLQPGPSDVWLVEPGSPSTVDSSHMHRPITAISLYSVGVRPSTDRLHGLGITRR